METIADIGLSVTPGLGLLLPRQVHYTGTISRSSGFYDSASRRFLQTNTCVAEFHATEQYGAFYALPRAAAILQIQESSCAALDNLPAIRGHCLVSVYS